jgi:DNA-binding transcriptional MocR family regulator
VVTRWEVGKAVRASDLPSPSRLIVLVLLEVAVPDTAEIPTRFSPSQATLVSETGLSRRTVQRHLEDLERAGWIVRQRPDEARQRAGECARYRLCVPVCQASERRQGWRQSDAPLASERRPPSVTVTPGVASERRLGGVTVTPPLSLDPLNHYQPVEPRASRARSRSTADERVTDALRLADEMDSALNGHQWSGSGR